MNFKMLSKRALSFLVALCMVMILLPVIVFAVDTDDQSVDDSTTTVKGYLQVGNDEAGKQLLYTFGPEKVKESEPCPDSIQNLIEKAKSDLQAYASKHNLTVIANTDNPNISNQSRIHDNRSYKWDQYPERHIVISGNYGKETVYTVLLMVEKPPVHNHTYGNWKNDGTHHWHECTEASCPNMAASLKDKAVHIYDNATDTTCNICGYNKTVSTVTVTVDGGTVNGSTSADIKLNSSATVKASATPAGKVFKGWEINGEIVSTSEEYTFTATASAMFKAVYENAAGTTDSYASNTATSSTPTYHDSPHSKRISATVVITVAVVLAGTGAAILIFTKKKKYTKQ